MFNHKAIKIGILSPYSSIYPLLLPSIVNGFYSAIPEKYQYYYQFIPEYVAQGGHFLYTEAVKKLLNFHQVDIVSGLVSYKNLPEINSLIETRKKMGFFFDVGEYIPNNSLINNSVFNNSFQMWQSEYALGNWTHKNFGDKGLMVMPVYDSGYHLQSAFRHGTINDGSKLIDLNVLPHIEGKSQVEGNKIVLLFERIKDKRYSFIHPLFCGTEAVEFIVAFYKSGLYKKIPLVVSSHMASEEVLHELKNLNITFYSASMWNLESEDDANTLFKKRYKNQTGNTPDFFSLLGYEAGLAFFQLHNEIINKNWNFVTKQLWEMTIQSPRGIRNFFLDSIYATPIINIEKITIDNNSIRKIVVEQGRSLNYDHETFELINRENVTGWQNPYLCV